MPLRSCLATTSFQYSFRVLGWVWFGLAWLGFPFPHYPAFLAAKIVGFTRRLLYTDNGSDFTSRHLEQVGADLKIRLVFSISGKPKGRGRIERFFSTVNQEKRSRRGSYSGWENVRETDRWSSVPLKGPIPDTILYTPSVVNTPRGIDVEITRLRATLRDLAARPARQNTREKLDALQYRRGVAKSLKIRWM